MSGSLRERKTQFGTEAYGLQDRLRASSYQSNERNALNSGSIHWHVRSNKQVINSSYAVTENRWSRYGCVEFRRAKQSAWIIWNKWLSHDYCRFINFIFIAGPTHNAFESAIKPWPARASIQSHLALRKPFAGTTRNADTLGRKKQPRMLGSVTDEASEGKRQQKKCFPNMPPQRCASRFKGFSSTQPFFDTKSSMSHKKCWKLKNAPQKGFLDF